MFNYLSILYKTFALTAWSTAIIFIVNDSINDSISRATPTQEQSSVDGYSR